ncbi:hypothetical protein YC2023_055354 [Brassica napus]
MLSSSGILCGYFLTKTVYPLCFSEPVYCTSLRPILVSVRAMAVSHTALRSQTQSSSSSREKQALTSLSDKDLPTLANGQRSSRVGVCLSHNLSYDVSVLLSVYGFKNDSFVSDKVTAPGGISFEDGIENIHIGGPAMIRAAAKNHKDVLIVLARELREFRSPTDGETRMFYEIVVAPKYTPKGPKSSKGTWKDEVEEACEKGIGAIEEPGGSIRDQDAIDCCNKYGVSSMLFNNVRHFRH